MIYEKRSHAYAVACAPSVIGSGFVAEIQIIFALSFDTGIRLHLERERETGKLVPQHRKSYTFSFQAILLSKLNLSSSFPQITTLHFEERNIGFEHLARILTKHAPKMNCAHCTLIIRIIQNTNKKLIVSTKLL